PRRPPSHGRGGLPQLSEGRAGREARADMRDVWRDDLVAFLLGGSFTFGEGDMQHPRQLDVAHVQTASHEEPRVLRSADARAEGAPELGVGPYPVPSDTGPRDRGPVRRPHGAKRFHRAIALGGRPWITRRAIESREAEM